jgi:hypothetical protein
MPVVLNHREAGDRIVVLVSLVFSGAALSAIAQLPARRVELQNVLGSPLGLDVSASLLVAPLLVSLCIAGMERLVRSSPELAAMPLRYTSTFWILPALVTFTAATAVPRQLGRPFSWAVVLVLLAALLGAVVTAEYGTAATIGRPQRVSRLVLNVAIYGAAFALFATIYGLQLRALGSAPVIVVVTFPLAVELLRGTAEQLESTLLYAAIVALIMGELIIPLNWLGLRGLAGGATLLVFFAAFGGIAQQQLAGRLTRQVAGEFIVVAIAGLLVLLLAS